MNRKNSIESPCIILIEPQMGENIGAAARAMLNFGLTDLRLVSPRDGWPNERAIANSSGAIEKMPEVRVFETLSDALSDCHFAIATTARRRDMVKPVFTPDAAMPEIAKIAQASQKTAIVFGPERTGISNDDLTLCNAIVTFPTNPDFASLNLSQAVLLMSWSWMQHNDNSSPHDMPTGSSSFAPQEEVGSFLERLETSLDNAGFFATAERKPATAMNIRNIFTRMRLTDQEVKTLHGIISALMGKKRP